MAAPVGMDKEQIFGMAEKEMEYRVELFNKLTHTCFNKCVEKKYKEGELNMGENSCIDRCVSNYWQVTNLVGQLLGASKPGMYDSSLLKILSSFLIFWAIEEWDCNCLLSSDVFYCLSAVFHICCCTVTFVIVYHCMLLLELFEAVTILAAISST